jgi:hypothetical protein
VRVTVRQTLSILPALLLLASCDELLKSSSSSGSKGGSLEDQIQISSESKPEIVAAFQAISDATREHNRAFLQYVESDGPANEAAFAAGIGHLDRVARAHGGLSKQVIDAVNATWAYEKTLFIPFDTMQRQMEGMKTWSSNQSVQIRGWVQIIDAQMDTFTHAVAFLERGEVPLLRQNFDKHRVPREVADEFLRLRELHGKEINGWKLEMFREEQASLQCYRDAFTSADPAKANERVAQAQQHEQKAKDFEGKMITGIREQLGAAGVL